MEEISSRGNNTFVFYGVCVLISVLIICFGSYQEKRMAEIKLVDKEIIAYEKELSELNQQEIKGIQIQCD